MASKDVQQAFLRFNTTGKGKDRSSRAAGSHWFRGTIFYFNETANWRIVPGHGAKKVLLIKHTSFDPKADHHEGQAYLKKIEAAVKVPDLAVFSRFEGDFLPDDQIHERIRYIMVQQIRDLLFEELAAKNGKQLDEGEDKKLRERLVGMYDSYEAYRQAVPCNLPEMPKVYRQIFEEQVRLKVKAYKDPAAVRQRERARARKVALDALGVDTKAQGSA